VIELSKYVLETLRKDEDYVLYRGRTYDAGSQILALSPLAAYSAPEILKSLEHAYSLKRRYETL
jgi:ribosomal protein S24E